jgi:hypothetical protein
MNNNLPIEIVYLQIKMNKKYFIKFLKYKYLK